MSANYDVVQHAADMLNHEVVALEEQFAIREATIDELDQHAQLRRANEALWEWLNAF